MNLFTKAFNLIRNRPILFISTVLLVVVFWQVTRTSVVDDTPPPETPLPSVRLITAGDGEQFNAVRTTGTVRAFSSGSITAERGGRVVSVPVQLGQAVAAGQTIAQLESATERAAVMQAEGAYAAAQAAARQTDFGITEAETSLQNAQNNARTAYQAAYSTVQGVVITQIDQFFSNPQTGIPGLRLDGRGQTQFLNNERRAYRELLPNWQRSADQLQVTDDLDAALVEAEAHVGRTLVLVDTFLTLFTDQPTVGRYTPGELQGFSTTFSNVRASLVSTQNNLAQARSGLRAAATAIARAESAAVGGAASAAEAQVMQALGALEAARANLAKTTLRAPVAGTVNSLNVRTGDFLSPNQVVAEVANNNALEVVTFIDTTQRADVAVGDVVRIGASATGTVAAIAPAVDPVTRKVEVRIALLATDAIKNGDTVSVTFAATRSVAQDVISLPLTAVRFSATDGFVFTVSEDARLVALPVVVGAIQGGRITIESGVTADMLVVADARGLTAGDEVRVLE